MSFLAPKTVETYLEKIKLKAPGTVKNIKSSLTKLDDFIQEKEGKTLDTYTQNLRNLQHDQQLEKLFDDLQIFINRLVGQGISRASARNHIYNIKGFIRYSGIKIHKEDIKDSLTFGRITQQEREGITKEQLQKIIENAKPNRRAFYLALSSSGMRPQESVQLRKRDLDTTKSRIMIRIPAKYTKTKKSRITFLSKEAESYVLPILKRIGPDDLVFGTNQNPQRAKLNEEQSFNILRERLGFVERYDSKTHKITLGGSLRSWFITKANRVDYGFGHALAGHDQYMKRYDRLSEDEKLQLYIKTEPTLSVYETPQDTSKDEEMKELKADFANLKEKRDAEIAEIKKEVKELWLATLHRPRIISGNGKVIGGPFVPNEVIKYLPKSLQEFLK